MEMEMNFLLRAFLWIPLCVILWAAVFISVDAWVYNKKIARIKKAICILLCLFAVGNTYFMFLHGKYVIAPLNPAECAELYDSLADLARSGKQGAEGVYMIECTAQNIEASVVFDEEGKEKFDPADQIRFPNPLLFWRSFSKNDVQIYMSGLIALKEQVGKVHVFNGIYRGELCMQKGDTEVRVYYDVEALETITPLQSYTCIPPKEVSLAVLVEQ